MRNIELKELCHHSFNQVISKRSRKWQPKDQTRMSLLAAQFFESLADDMDHSWGDFITDVPEILVLLFAAGVWILFQPMQMRGTL